LISNCIYINWKKAKLSQQLNYYDIVNFLTQLILPYYLMPTFGYYRGIIWYVHCVYEINQSVTYVLTNRGYLISELSSTAGGSIRRTRALKSLPMGTSMNDTRGRVIGDIKSLSGSFISQSKAFSPVLIKKQNTHWTIILE